MKAKLSLLSALILSLIVSVYTEASQLVCVAGKFSNTGNLIELYPLAPRIVIVEDNIISLFDFATNVNPADTVIFNQQLDFSRLVPYGNSVVGEISGNSIVGNLTVAHFNEEIRLLIGINSSAGTGLISSEDPTNLEFSNLSCYRTE